MSGATTSAAAASAPVVSNAPAAPGTASSRFDGIYEGPGTVPEGANCGTAPARWVVTMTVTNGQFRLVNTMSNFGGPTITGEVTADGTVRNARGRLGKIEGSSFRGGSRWPSPEGCRHSYDLTKAG
jgi:hypothetical protein